MLYPTAEALLDAYVTHYEAHKQGLPTVRRSIKDVQEARIRMRQYQDMMDDLEFKDPQALTLLHQDRILSRDSCFQYYTEHLQSLDQVHVANILKTIIEDLSITDLIFFHPYSAP